jgi:adenylate cyclase
MPSFDIQAPDNKTFVYQLTRPEVTIGRDLQNDLVLADPRVSRRHAIVRQTADGIRLSDLKTNNGTFVNGQRITEVKLADGDAIKIGNCKLTFTAVEPPPLVSQEMRQILQKRPGEVLDTSFLANLTASKETPPIVYRQALEKKERILALFYELSCKLGSVFSLEEIYQKVCEIVLQVTPASRCLIFRKDAEGEFKEVSARLREGNLVIPPLPVSKAVFAKVARKRVSLLLEHAQREGISLFSRSLRLNQIQSVMAVPIVGRRALLGIIYADCYDLLKTFSPDDLDLLNAVAVQTGMAIDTITTSERLQREAQARASYERFLPQQIVDDMLRSPEKVKLGGVRQMVTALFSDLRGFTALSEDCQPEIVVNLLNRYFTLASEIIFRHGGTLDKYIGDGLLALFGAPTVSERDAVKAVRAAVDLQRALMGFNQELAEIQLPPAAVGIGINTGMAIVGYIGSEHRLDYTAIGDTINTAARLESIAQPGQIVISESTLQALDESFHLKPLETVKLKGKSESLRIAEVIWQQPTSRASA